jgi:hypothetical protein
MITEVSLAEPTQPFLRLNRFHVVRFSQESDWGRWGFRLRFITMEPISFHEGRFKEDACIIDVNCMKFPIRDVISLGRSWNWRDIVWMRKALRVKYIYDAPIQLSFEQARDEIVELICSKRWFSKTQDRESEKQFRERMAMCENMRDLIMGRRVDPMLKKRYHWMGAISFYGEWVG